MLPLIGVPHPSSLNTTNNDDNTGSVSESTTLLPNRTPPLDDLDLILDSVVDNINIVEVDSDTEEEQAEASSVWFLGGLLPNMRIRYFQNQNNNDNNNNRRSGPRRRIASRETHNNSMTREELLFSTERLTSSSSDEDEEMDRSSRRMAVDEPVGSSYSTFGEFERLNPSQRSQDMEINRNGENENSDNDGADATPESEAALAATSDDNANLNDSVEEEDWENILNTEDVTQLTTRLRCLFALLTCPIVPLAATLTLLLLWVLYSALLLDWGLPCDQPLRLYALLSAAMFAYTPHHRTVKRYLFGYWRERDGPVRPWKVRVYDQAYHAACLLWMYAGISWTTHAETCSLTSPNLYKSTRIFVLVQTVFMSILVIPLLCLPCIYLWLVRQASVIANNRRERRRKRADPAKIMASFTEVDISKDENQALLEGQECCICMCDYTDEMDQATAGVSVQGAATRAFSADSEATENNGIIQTQCGHLFHKSCIATWLKTPYSGSCKCPLCREDLVPPEDGTSNEVSDEENQRTPQSDSNSLLLYVDTRPSLLDQGQVASEEIMVDLGAAA